MKSYLLLGSAIFFIISDTLTADVLPYGSGSTTNDTVALLFSAEKSYLAFNTEGYGNATVSEVTSIDDANTFLVNIEDFPPIVGQRVTVRVSGVAVPDINGKCESEKVKGRQAKQFTAKALYSAKTIQLRNIDRGENFRILAEVYVDGESLADNLIKRGYARAYHVGSRLSWCGA